MPLVNGDNPSSSLARGREFWRRAVAAVCARLAAAYSATSLMHTPVSIGELVVMSDFGDDLCAAGHNIDVVDNGNKKGDCVNQDDLGLAILMATARWLWRRVIFI
jgi:hypothetical protein